MAEKYFTVKAGGTYLANRVALDLDVVPLGLLMRMLAMHPSQPKSARALADTGVGIGRTQIQNGLAELEAKGFRYRFLAQSAEGRLMTIVLTMEEPCQPEDALEAVPVKLQERIVRCTSHPALKINQSDKPAKDNAPVDNLENKGISPGRTDSQDSGRRSDEPVDNSENTENFRNLGESVSSGRTASQVTGTRLTGTRSARPHISKDISKLSKDSHSPKRSKDLHPTNQGGVESSPASVDVGGVVGGVKVSSGGDAALAGQVSPAEDDFELFSRCIPPGRMRKVLTGKAGVRVASALRRALDSGWLASEILWRLDNNPVPDSPRNLAGLMIHRVEEIAHSRPPSALPGSARGSRSTTGVGQVVDPLEEAQKKYVLAKVAAQKAEAELSDAQRADRCRREQLAKEGKQIA